MYYNALLQYKLFVLLKLNIKFRYKKNTQQQSTTTTNTTSYRSIKSKNIYDKNKLISSFSSCRIINAHYGKDYIYLSNVRHYKYEL